jgi:LETM1 and EF-hand domain-containing protein 1
MFNDELMLDNISRPQLVAMCRYMGVQHYGNDNLLRFQLRNRVRQLKKDDQVGIVKPVDENCCVIYFI